MRSEVQARGVAGAPKRGFDRMNNRLNRHRGLGRLGLGLGLVALMVAGWTTQASAICLAPPGDVNGNGATDVTDAQCAFLGTLWQINIANGVPTSQPTCAGTSILRADVNCDNSITVSDATIVVSLALGLELDSSIDANGDLCVDVCEGATASCYDAYERGQLSARNSMKPVFILMVSQNWPA